MSFELNNFLACPIDGSPLVRDDRGWISPSGRTYPEIDGIPILFHPDSPDTFDAMAQTKRFANPQSFAKDPWLIETLGLNANEKQSLRRQFESGDYSVDPVISHMVGATCGNLYVHNIGKLPRYPIPDFRWKQGNGRVLLDLGCNWGRWCVAAAREGFKPIGIDPQIGALLAARRLCKKMGIEAHFICGDARHPPIISDRIDLVFSYSVLQHLSRPDVNRIAAQVHRVLKPRGQVIVQMPHRYGIRCFYQLAKRRFKDGDGFQVRYWSRKQLREVFGQIGPVTFTTEGYFGIGLQPADKDLLPTSYQKIVTFSEFLRRNEKLVPFARSFADSLYVHAEKTE
jgi:SAM-dependent methyltransferase/uncharacterized protein YbaR (Trm112 family)